MKNITILGTGAMGTRIAEKLIDTGFNLTVYNRSKDNALSLIKAGATYKATPMEAVEDADVVISLLTNDEASQKVWLDTSTGAINGLKKGAIAIESSTLSIDCIEKISTSFATQGHIFIDAPIVGSRPQAETGSLIYLLGGDTRNIEQIKPILSKLSSSIFHIGKTGMGAKMKLAVNAYFGVQVSAYCEIVGSMNKSDINHSDAIELLNELPITSPALQIMGKLINAEKFAPLFPINLVEKDLRYMLALSRENDASLPVVKATHNTFKNAIDAGLGNENIHSIAKLYI